MIKDMYRNEYLFKKNVKKFSYFFLFCKKFLKIVFKPTVLKNSLIFLLKIVKSYFQNIIAT